MLWTSSQQTVIDQFIQEIKTIGWFKQVGEPSEKYWVIDTIWEACDTYGHQMLEVWGQNSELIEQKALRQLKDEQIDAIFESTKLYATWRIKSDKKPVKINPESRKKF